MKKLYAALIVLSVVTACGYNHHQPAIEKTRFTQSDSNADSMLNFAEYQTLVSLQAKAGYKEARKVMAMELEDSQELLQDRFRKLDLDDDGLLSAAELNAA